MASRRKGRNLAEYPLLVQSAEGVFLFRSILSDSMFDEWLCDPSLGSFVGSGSNFAVTARSAVLSLTIHQNFADLVVMQVPCETCVKRGCAAICPSGLLFP